MKSSLAGCLVWLLQLQRLIRTGPSSDGEPAEREAFREAKKKRSNI